MRVSYQSKQCIHLGSRVSDYNTISLNSWFQVLDLVLGHGDDLFRRAQSKALVSIHDLEAGKGGELTHDNDYSGALDLTEKTAKEAMTPIESRLCLDVDSNLDWPWKTEVILKKN
ncbi:DUF21 domain-containing protein At4g14240-like [Rosa chinensis]|uniref:DUF21 domain-containing protein At4g14240-like n=1 Tax=Rosa chinensis TaxID=74649 RepID=UPI001AD94880|nr:DUF21 domain-containing protein At4g14240-like [Rosa chinensis]